MKREEDDLLGLIERIAVFIRWGNAMDSMNDLANMKASRRDEGFDIVAASHCKSFAACAFSRCNIYIKGGQSWK